MSRALTCGLSVALALAGWAMEPPRPDEPDHFTPADRRAMLDLARRSAAGARDLAFDPTMMPAKLLRDTGLPLILSAHRPGKEPLLAADSRDDATLFARIAQTVQMLRQTGQLGPLDAVRFKLDIVLGRQPLDLVAGAAPALGMEGLRLRTPAEELLLPASEALRLDLSSGEAFVRYALGRLKPTAGGLRDVSAERFTALSFIERDPGGGGPPVDLYRGMPIAERVTRARLLAACEAAGDWLLRFQKPDGSFHYLYNAATDAVEDEEYEITRHAGTAWSLAHLGAATGQRRFRDGARRAIEWLLGHLRTRDGMAWLEHGGERQLGAAALAAVALLEHRAATRAPILGARRFGREARQLGRFLVFMQRDDGFFHTDYDPKGRRGFIPDGHVPLFAPGEAFLALVRLRRALPDPAWQRAAVRAADFMAACRDAWYYEHDLRMIHPDSWTMMALDELHATGAAQRAHADYCFFLAHEMLKEQEEPGTARWRDHVGAPRVSLDAPESAVAAGRCEGLLAAWRLARRMGAATDGYRRAILLSARFQLAHQYDAVNSYLLPNPSRARGGFYASYAAHRIRIDYVQHNISALLGAAEVLQAEERE